MFRTGDGRLHVVWQSNDHAKGVSLHYSTLGTGAKLVNTGKILSISGWSSLTTYPRLVPAPGGGIRLVFTGANGKINDPFNLDAMYSATSGPAGNTDMVVERIDVFPGIGKPFVNVDGVTMRFDKDRVVITWRRGDSDAASAA